MKNSIQKFNLKELIGSLIIVMIGLTITVLFGWIISALVTTIFAFFFFRFMSSFKIESRMDNFCKNCGEKLSWIKQYSKYYCRNCQQYSPVCSACRKDLFWIPNYGQYYCNECQKYVKIQKKDNRKSKESKKRLSSKKSRKG